MRTRICLARCWEKANALPTIYGGLGSSAQMAAWQASFVAEAACLGARDHVQALLDLVKAFETVPHDVIAAAARVRGYPLCILRLSLAAHRLRRSLGVDGVYSRLIRATRGITDGSGLATTELRVMLTGTMEELQERWAGLLTLKLFVDDLTIAACGLPKVVVATLVSALDFGIGRLEGDFRMEVSAKKSKLVAGRPALAEAVASRLTAKRIGTATGAKLLGTDAVGGRRRGTKVARARLVQFCTKTGRFSSLRRLGINTVQMVRSTGPPAILYGCEIMGVADTQLHTIRTKVASAAAADAGGKSPDLVLYAADGPSGTLDPAFMAHTAPLSMWAMVCWCGWFPADVMQKAADDAAAKLATAACSWWSVVTGPTAALLASRRRLGWTLDSALQVTDDLGYLWRFDLDSPAAVVKAAQGAVRRWRVQRLAAQHSGLLPPSCDLPDFVHFPSVVVDCGQFLSPLLHAKGSGARASSDWSPAWLSSLFSAVVGGQWPQARRAAVPAWGIHDARCQLCLGAVGTLEHRHRCPATVPAGGWPAPAPRACAPVACCCCACRS